MSPALRILVVLIVLIPSLAQPAAAQTLPVCGYDPLIAGMFSQTSQARWADWIARLSGEKPVRAGNQAGFITTRHTRLMAGNDPSARAFDFVNETVSGLLGSRAKIGVVPYLMYKPPDEIYNANNLVVDLPGALHPEQVVVLSAHLDSISANLTAPAPGADDNGSGVAALLEAARIFRHYRFDRTIRLIFFTGEEQYEVGSQAYLVDHPPKDVIADINLDMFSYDRDNDHCIELHASMLPASLPVAACYQDTITSYGLNLKAELVTGAASLQSDQSSYWAYGVGSILVMENATRPNPASLCAGTDVNPYYHSSNDRLEHINLDTGYAAALAGIATTASLAGSLEVCRSLDCQAELPRGAFWNSLGYHVSLP